MQRVQKPDLPDPPTFAEDVKQYILALPNDDIDPENLDKQDKPHRVKKSFEDQMKPSKTFTKEDVDDMVIVLRACGYGDGFDAKDRRRATEALRRIRAQVISLIGFQFQ